MRFRSLALALLTSAVVLLCPTAANADTALTQSFESGLQSWTTTGFWHVQSNPQAISVKSPEINPALVTLPDSGQLPQAFDGSGVAWFGEASTGTYCGANFSTSQEPKSGCTSQSAQQGTLTSPAFSLAGAQSAILRFRSWWEIEGVNADDFDEMRVQYSTNGSTWTDAGELNPVDNPAADHFAPYSNTGLSSTPAWKEYLVDLSGAIGQPSVKVRFSFSTDDALYNGFRGWLVDNVSVSTPFDAPAPTIASVKTCSGLSATQVWTVTGSNFVQNSTVSVDGTTIPSAGISASDRIELPAGNAGNHTLEVKSPNGTTATKTFAAGNCAEQGTFGPSGAQARPTRTQVMCTYVVIEAADTCTATVADATGGGKVPTGKVTFTSGNGGAFQGNTCTLAKANLSTVSSCAVKFIPPKNKALAVTGAYGGNSDLEPSSGSTSFLMAGMGNNVYGPTIPTWENSSIAVTVNNPVGGSTVSAAASAGGSGGSKSSAICASGLSSGGSARSSSAAPIAGISAKPTGLFKKKSKLKFKRRKRNVVIGTSARKAKAKKGKVKLKIRFDKRKLAKVLGRRRSVRTVVRITIKVPGKAQPLVRYKVLTLKRKGALPKADTKKAKKEGSKRSRAAASERIVVEGAAPARIEARAAQVRGASWTGNDGCGTLIVYALNGGNGVVADTTFKYQGVMNCFSQSGEASQLRSDVVSGRAAPTSATPSQANFTFIGSQGYYSYTLSGTLTDGGGSANGRVGVAAPGLNCATDVNVVFAPGVPFS